MKELKIILQDERSAPTEKEKKEKSDFNFGKLGVGMLFSLAILLFAISTLHDDMQNELDYQFYLADMMQTMIISLFALCFYYAEKKQPYWGLFYLFGAIVMMFVLICYYDKMKNIAIEKKQATAICSCCLEKPADHQERFCH